MSAANYTGGTPGPETAAEPSEGALRAAEGHSGGWQPGDKALIEVEVQGRPIAGCHFVRMLAGYAETAIRVTDREVYGIASLGIRAALDGDA